MGPYQSEQAARRLLGEFVMRCVATCDDGGRSGEIQFRLALVPIEESTTLLFDPMIMRRGVLA